MPIRILLPAKLLGDGILVELDPPIIIPLNGLLRLFFLLSKALVNLILIYLAIYDLTNSICNCIFCFCSSVFDSDFKIFSSYSYSFI